jgi:hypothetical protein
VIANPSAYTPPLTRSTPLLAPLLAPLSTRKHSAHRREHTHAPATISTTTHRSPSLCTSRGPLSRRATDERWSARDPESIDVCVYVDPVAEQAALEERARLDLGRVSAAPPPGTAPLLVLRVDEHRVMCTVRALSGSPPVSERSMLLRGRRAPRHCGRGLVDEQLGPAASAGESVRNSARSTRVRT